MLLNFGGFLLLKTLQTNYTVVNFTTEYLTIWISVENWFYPVTKHLYCKYIRGFYEQKMLFECFVYS